MLLPGSVVDARAELVAEAKNTDFFGLSVGERKPLSAQSTVCNVWLEFSGSAEHFGGAQPRARLCADRVRLM